MGDGAADEPAALDGELVVGGLLDPGGDSGEHPVLHGQGLIAGDALTGGDAPTGGDGLTGGEANAIAPGKRPLSSMTPVIVLEKQVPVLATGSPGGARIITTVLQNLINVIDFKLNIAQAISMPRMHHQWMPDYLRLETIVSPDTIAVLKKMGHEIRIPLSV